MYPPQAKPLPHYNQAQRPAGVIYLVQLLLHTRDYHNDGHKGAEEEEEGEDEAGDGGVLGRGAAAAEQTRRGAAETGHLQREHPRVREVQIWPGKW